MLVLKSLSVQECLYVIELVCDKVVFFKKCLYFIKMNKSCLTLCRWFVLTRIKKNIAIFSTRLRCKDTCYCINVIMKLQTQWEVCQKWYCSARFGSGSDGHMGHSIVFSSYELFYYHLIVVMPYLPNRFFPCLSITMYRNYYFLIQISNTERFTCLWVIVSTYRIRYSIGWIASRSVTEIKHWRQ